MCNQLSQEEAVAQMRREATELTRELIQFLATKPRRTTVVMEAAKNLFQFASMQLPPEDIGTASFVLAQLAGNLLQASNKPQAAPAGVPIH